MRLVEFMHKSDVTCPLANRKWDDGGDDKRTVVNPLPFLISSDDSLFGEVYDLADDLYYEYKENGIAPPVEEIPVGALVGMEVCLDPKGSRSEKNITVLNQSGLYYVLDGNHRAAAAISAGKSTIKANVYRKIS